MKTLAPWWVLALAGCHNIPDGTWREFLLPMLLGTVFVLVIHRIWVWMAEAGWRADPAPHVGLAEPTTLQQKIQAEAKKEQAAGEKMLGEDTGIYPGRITWVDRDDDEGPHGAGKPVN